jgi:hypothetical protein
MPTTIHQHVMDEVLSKTNQKRQMSDTFKMFDEIEIVPQFYFQKLIFNV